MSALQRGLGIMIRRLREAKGWTQAELAKKARVTQGFISQLEAGTRKNPGIVIAHRLAEALGVPMDELIGRRRTRP